MAAVLQHCVMHLVHLKERILALPLWHCMQNTALFVDAATLERLSNDVKVFNPWMQMSVVVSGLAQGSPHMWPFRCHSK